MTYHVYVLIDPRDQRPFYVGCTINPRKRLNEHGSDAYSAAYGRVREIRAVRQRPRLEVLETFKSLRKAIQCERQTIAVLEAMFGLLNRDKAREFAS